MASPGLAFVAVSERAWKAYDSARLTRNYWDFGPVRSNLARPQPETPGTAPVHVFLQVAESLAIIHEEGLPSVYARHEAMAAHVRERTLAMGFGLLFPDLDRWSPTLTALRTPEGVTPTKLRERLMRHGILVAEGLGKYAGQCIRIGHMGDIRLSDVDRTCDAIDAVLAEAR
jgi:aspartate aminotransferase-like enzyme